MSDEKKIHVFEKAGLGIAPFRFVGIERRVGPMLLPGTACTYVGAPGQPVGSCEFCGEAIAECCIIQDRTGKTFIVGNVCVGKTGDAGLISNIKRAINEHRRVAKLAKDQKTVTRGRELLQNPEIRKALEAMPHPSPWRADRGENFLNYAEWILAGTDYYNLRSKVGVSKQLESLARINPTAEGGFVTVQDGTLQDVTLDDLTGDKI